MPIGNITTHADWELATKNHRCIVFVDGAWNIQMVHFRRPFAKFADWCQTHTNTRALTMSINPHDTTNDVWHICQELWAQNNIDPGGLKNFGGAGRVLWIDKGQIVDYAWCFEVETIEMLTERTQKAFR